MKTFSSVDEVLDFAIQREEMAAKFYNSLAQRVKREEMREVFLAFAKEEEGHQRILEAVKEGKTVKPLAEKVLDLKIGDYLVDVEVHPELDYQEALIIAMKREKASYKLYMHLSQATDDAGLRDTFLRLAQEEAKHKLRFELEYDDAILKEN